MEKEKRNHPSPQFHCGLRLTGVNLTQGSVGEPPSQSIFSPFPATLTKTSTGM